MIPLPAAIAKHLRPNATLLVVPVEPQPDGWSTLTGEPVWLRMPASGPIPVATKVTCPLKPGETYYVQEALRGVIDTKIDDRETMPVTAYEADGDHLWTKDKFRVPWRWGKRKAIPARSMPDWAARIRKTTTRVELRRVRTITEAELIMSGFKEVVEVNGASRVVATAGMSFEMWMESEYPGSWDRDDYAWFVFYTDTLGKD